MNYFAHGIRFVDRPWFLAGTALPDWMHVIDRQARLRHGRVAQAADGSHSVEAELAAGAMQHFADDHWFHKTRAFAEVSAELGRMFRDFLGPGDGFRCGFLGHIGCEMILDSVLIEQYPDRLNRYYAGLSQLDSGKLAAAVSSLLGRPTPCEGWLLRFCGEQFLRDYADSDRLARRLNQVLARIKLEPLPAAIADVLTAGRAIVHSRAEGLLPPSRFVVPSSVFVEAH